MTYALSGMQTPHTPCWVVLYLSPPAPLGYAYPEYPIYEMTYALSGMHFLSPTPNPSGMHTPLSPAKICFKLYRVCIPHIFHVANDFISPPPTPLGLHTPLFPYTICLTLSRVCIPLSPLLHPSGMHTPQSSAKRYLKLYRVYIPPTTPFRI